MSGCFFLKHGVLLLLLLPLLLLVCGIARTVHSEKQMAIERRRNAENQQRQMQSQAQQLFRRGLRRDDGTSIITSRQLPAVRVDLTRSGDVTATANNSPLRH